MRRGERKIKSEWVEQAIAEDGAQSSLNLSLKRGEDDQNPFEYDTPVTWYELLKIFFFILSGIAFIRAIIVISCVLLAYCCARIATLGLIGDDAVYKKPLSKLRRYALFPISPLCRIVLFSLGFYRIPVHGSLSPHACLITPNHVSMFDLLATYWLLLPSALSKAETFNIPIIGTIFRALQVIPVQRDDNKHKKLAMDLINRFADSREHNSDLNSRFPPILVFPQGTTTKQNFLTMFQRGAFIPGKPVQPLVLRYSWTNFNPAFIVNRKGDLYLLRHLCQFVMHLEVKFLPVHFPDVEERRNPTLFANHVRQIIADDLGATTTDHCYEDARLYRAALNIEEGKYNYRGSWDAAVRGLLSIVPIKGSIPLKGLFLKQIKDIDGNSDQRRRFSLNEAKAILEDFVRFDKNGDGLISFEEFSFATGLEPEKRQTRQVFDFFDRDHSGMIDFKELVIGMALCNPYSTSPQERARLAFSIYDTNNDGYVSESELRVLLRYSGDSSTSLHRRATEEQLESLVSKVKESRENKSPSPDESEEILISWEEFCAFGAMKPELISTALLSVDGARPGQPKFFPSLIRRPSSRIETQGE